jgi:hypothetical protein
MLGSYLLKKILKSNPQKLEAKNFDDQWEKKKYFIIVSPSGKGVGMRPN